MGGLIVLISTKHPGWMKLELMVYRAYIPIPYHRSVHLSFAHSDAHTHTHVRLLSLKRVRDWGFVIGSADQIVNRDTISYQFIALWNFLIIKWKRQSTWKYLPINRWHVEFDRATVVCTSKNHFYHYMRNWCIYISILLFFDLFFIIFHLTRKVKRMLVRK